MSTLNLGVASSMGGPAAAGGRGAGGSGHLGGSVLGRDRAHPRRPGVPTGLPAVRQPCRRRGSDPGNLRPGVPVAGRLHPGHLRGLVAPDHHQPVPGHGPSPAEDPLRRAGRGRLGEAGLRRARPRAGLRAAQPRPGGAAGPGHSAGRFPRRRGAVRPGRAVLRGDRPDPGRQGRYGPVPHPPGPGAAAGGAWPTATRPVSIPPE